MSLTATNQIELGFEAIDFLLPDTLSGISKNYSDIKGRYGTVVMFICNHCPFVIHIQEELVKLANDYMSKGIGFVAISSNDVVNYPQDGPGEMKVVGEEANYPFPYLYDETQDVARAYQAACTPDFSVFDKHNKCVYRGQLDDSRPGNGIDLSGTDLRKVFDLLLEGKSIPKENQFPSVGCNIKWK